MPQEAVSKKGANAIDMGKVSEAVRLLNPHLTGAATPPAAAPVAVTRRKGKRRRCPNKTELAFGRLLESRMRRGEIVSYDFEGLTLRWGNDESFSYTPDYVVSEAIHVTTDREQPFVRLVMCEVKGGHIWTKDSDRFRHARDNFPLYRFEMWQKTKEGFEQIR